MSAKRTTALIIVFSQLLLAAAVYAGVFSSRHASFTVNIADVKLVEIADPPYPLCVGVSRAGRQAVYYNDFESIPLDWVVFNGTLTPRGYIAPQGYWGLTSGFKGSGLRGFPLVWQVREHDTYYYVYPVGDTSPDVRFIPRTNNAIRIDSYTAGASSLGNGYLFIIAPRELFNNTVVNNRFDVYFSFWGTRTLGFIDLVNATIDRRDDAVIFSTYNDWNPYWRRYGTPSYIWLYNVSQAGGPISYNVNSSVGDLSGYAPHLTYVITMTDYWTGQTVYFDVFWVAIYDSATRALVYNFTFPYNRYSVILERSGTHGDYGYLDFGMTGFTGAYWNQNLSSTFTTTGAWFSSKVNLRRGVGWAGILLTNTTHHYVVAINTTGWLMINYYNGLTWTTLASWSIQGYTNNTWYIPVVYFKRDPGAITFTIYLYDAQGARLLYVEFGSTTPTLIFTPTYIGLAVNTTNRLYLDAAFDDFLFAPAIPINAEFVNLPGPGYTVSIYDNLGLHVNSATSTTTSVNVSLVTDLVLGTGYNGKFIIYYPNMTTCLLHTVPSTEVVLGGDTYIVHWRNTSVNTLYMVVQAYLGYGSNVTTGPLFNITIYPGDTRYTYLWLDQTNSAIPSTLYLNLTLVNAAGAASTKIQVHGGLVVSDTTSAIPLAGTGNYVHIEGYFTQPTQSATLRLYIVACSSPTLAVCYVVKVTVYLSTIE